MDWLSSASRPQLVAAAVLGVHVPSDGTLDGVSVDDIVMVTERVHGNKVRLSISALALRVMCEVDADTPLTQAVGDLLHAVGGVTSTAPLGFEGFEGLCALLLAVQKMGYSVLGVKVSFGAAFRGAVFARGADRFVFSPPVATSEALDVGVVQSMGQFPGSAIVDDDSGAPVVLSGPGPVAKNAPNAPFADVATRLLSDVDVFLSVKRYVEGDVTVGTVCEEVFKVATAKAAWDSIAPNGTCWPGPCSCWAAWQCCSNPLCVLTSNGHPWSMKAHCPVRAVNAVVCPRQVPVLWSSSCHSGTTTVPRAPPMLRVALSWLLLSQPRN
jgi:hypothetical protein